MTINTLKPAGALTACGILIIMSEKQNPDIVIDAITNTDKTYSCITINTPTIRRYAYLEKLKSPFIFGDINFDLENVVPSVYVLAATKDELKRLSGKSVDEIKDIAMDWADDNLDMKILPDIIKDVVEVFTKINESAPQNTNDTSKKAEV